MKKMKYLSDDKVKIKKSWFMKIFDFIIKRNYVVRGGAFGDPYILKNHDTSKSLGTWREFEWEGEKYSIEPGYIRHNDGSVELLEISFVSLEKSGIIKKIKKS